MGHHRAGDRFQSDKPFWGHLVEQPFGDLSQELQFIIGPDKLVLSFGDPSALPALRLFATTTDDTDLGIDVLWRLNTIDPPPADHLLSQLEGAQGHVAEMSPASVEGLLAAAAVALRRRRG